MSLSKYIFHYHDYQMITIVTILTYCDDKKHGVTVHVQLHVLDDDRIKKLLAFTQFTMFTHFAY